jgi:hypothetical protein
MIITEWMARAKEKKSEPPVPSKGRSKMNEARVYGLHRPLAHNTRIVRMLAPPPPPPPNQYSFSSFQCCRILSTNERGKERHHHDVRSSPLPPSLLPPSLPSSFPSSLSPSSYFENGRRPGRPPAATMPRFCERARLACIRVAQASAVSSHLGGLQKPSRLEKNSPGCLRLACAKEEGVWLREG